MSSTLHTKSTVVTWQEFTAHDAIRVMVGHATGTDPDYLIGYHYHHDASNKDLPFNKDL